MTRYQVLSWHDIPAQIRAEAGAETVNVEMPPRFMAMIDKKATDEGLTGEDDYLDGWQWSEPTERDGSPAAVAEAVRNELLDAF